MSLPHIGEVIGGRDHTTVMYGIRKIASGIKNNDHMGALLSQQKFLHSTGQFIFLTIALPLAGFAVQYWWTGSIGPLYTMGFPFLMEAAYQFVWGYSLLNYWFAGTFFIRRSSFLPVICLVA